MKKEAAYSAAALGSVSIVFASAGACWGHASVEAPVLDLRSSATLVQPGRTNPDEQFGRGGATEGLILGMRLEPNGDEGLTVKFVTGGSDAADKGVQEGDVILRANGHVVATQDDLTTAIAGTRDAHHKRILLLVVHNGNRVFVPLPIGDPKS